MRKTIALMLTSIAAVLAIATMAFAASKTITVKLTGSEETPKGDPKGKGTAKVTLNSTTGQVCYKLSWSGIDTPTASHIHQGAKGKAGPVVIPLFSGTPKKSACVTASKSLVGKILKTPTSYYVNVHTAKYKDGAVRGQL
jgi:TRAP-type C4-dicarboxylate transport system substrate-binding protein